MIMAKYRRMLQVDSSVQVPVGWFQDEVRGSLVMLTDLRGT